MKNNPETTYNKKTFVLDNATIKISDESVPKTNQEIKTVLKNFYDVCNEIAENLKIRKVNTSKLFYKKTELEKMKNSDEYNFI